jgi:hypothetical protein
MIVPASCGKSFEQTRRITVSVILRTRKNLKSNLKIDNSAQSYKAYPCLVNKIRHEKVIVTGKIFFKAMKIILFGQNNNYFHYGII